MNELFRAGLEMQRFLSGRNIPFCVIGGVAVARWGEVRATKDVDFTLYSGFEDESRIVVALLDAFRPRRANSLQFALENRVVLIESSAGIRLDVSLGGLPFEAEMMDRASPWEYEPGIQLMTCSAEDLIVLKTFAGRPLDVRDVEGVIIRQGSALDWNYIERQLPPLLEIKEDREAWPRLLEMRRNEGA